MLTQTKTRRMLENKFLQHLANNPFPEELNELPLERARQIVQIIEPIAKTAMPLVLDRFPEAVRWLDTLEDIIQQRANDLIFVGRIGRNNRIEHYYSRLSRMDVAQLVRMFMWGSVEVRNRQRNFVRVATIGLRVN